MIQPMCQITLQTPFITILSEKKNWKIFFLYISDALIFFIFTVKFNDIYYHNTIKTNLLINNYIYVLL